MASPCVLITSCSDFQVEEIIKDILQKESLPEGKVVIENIFSYDWSINTKYYSADISICTTRDRTIGDQEFADSVQAFIVYFDPEEEKSFHQMKSWCPYLDQIDPEIKMLVCQRCSDKSSVSRLTVQKWCIDKGFELVELDPEQESEGELEDDFMETTGVKRIIQSLHAHTWPNLVLKDNRHSVSPYIRQLMKGEHDSKMSLQDGTDNDNTATNDCDDHEDNKSQGFQDDFQDFQSHSSSNDSSAFGTSAPNTVDSTNDVTQGGSSGSNVNSNVESDTSVVNENEDSHKHGEAKAAKSEGKEKVKQPSKEERLDSMLPSEDQALFEALGSEDPDGESFEKLFEKFATMKQKASTLPLEQRKKYAENVAIAFWKAMGGDEDEIGDLDSD